MKLYLKKKTPQSNSSIISSIVRQYFHIVEGVYVRWLNKGDEKIRKFFIFQKHNNFLLLGNERGFYLKKESVYIFILAGFYLSSGEY